MECLCVCDGSCMSGFLHCHHLSVRWRRKRLVVCIVRIVVAGLRGRRRPMQRRVHLWHTRWTQHRRQQLARRHGRRNQCGNLMLCTVCVHTHSLLARPHLRHVRRKAVLEAAVDQCVRTAQRYLRGEMRMCWCLWFVVRWMCRSHVRAQVLGQVFTGVLELIFIQNYIKQFRRTLG